MKRSILFMMALLVFGGGQLFAQDLSKISSAKSLSLVENLMSGANVNKEQAMGGAGALFNMAQEEMDNKDFKSLTDAVPEMNSLLDAVPGAGKSSMLGTAATALTGMPKVQATFDKLGISQDKVALFTPILVNYVEKKGGKALGSKLAGIFK